MTGEFMSIDQQGNKVLGSGALKPWKEDKGGLRLGLWNRALQAPNPDQRLLGWKSELFFIAVPLLQVIKRQRGCRENPKVLKDRTLSAK